MPKLKKLLIADDDKFIRDSLKVFFSGHFAVSIACDGCSVLKALSDEAFDILLLDLNLPQMSGESVLAALKSMDASVLTFVMTGDMEIETERRVRGMGVDGYFLKPVERGLLLRSMKAALEFRRKLKKDGPAAHTLQKKSTRRG